MKLLVVNSKGIGAIFIKLFTFSRWNHTAIWFDDDTVVEALAYSGVRCVSYERFKKAFPNHEIIQIGVPEEFKARKFALEQVGKKYDWTAIFSLIFQRKWQEPDSWFCSELSEAIIQSGGVKRFRDVVHRITPHQSWAVY